MKEIINELDTLKLKTSLLQKTMSTGLQARLQMGRKYF